jgi:micrococcal nuclease
LSRKVLLAFFAGFVAGIVSVFAVAVALTRPSGESLSLSKIARQDTGGQNYLAERPETHQELSAETGAETYACTIRGVTDGDTIRCVEGDTRVRLLLIDSPESGQGEYYYAARDFVARLLPLGSPVTLEIDSEPRDKYGRALAYAWLPDGRLANEEIVRAGFALAFDYNGKNVRYLDRIVAAEEAARQTRTGFWAAGEVACAPADFRHRRCRGFVR